MNAELILIIIVCAAAILLPALIASHRNHNNTLPIAICSILSPLSFGILWLVALIWACTDNTSTGEI